MFVVAEYILANKFSMLLLIRKHDKSNLLECRHEKRNRKEKGKNCQSQGLNSGKQLLRKIVGGPNEKKYIHNPADRGFHDSICHIELSGDQP